VPNTQAKVNTTHNAQRIHYVHKTLRRAGLAPKGGIAVKGPSDELPSHSLWASDAFARGVRGGENTGKVHPDMSDMRESTRHCGALV